MRCQSPSIRWREGRARDSGDEPEVPSDGLDEAEGAALPSDPAQGGVDGPACEGGGERGAGAAATGRRAGESPPAGLGERNEAIGREGMGRERVRPAGSATGP